MSASPPFPAEPLSEVVPISALSKAGFSVAHVDVNSYYGGDDTSLTLDELVEWADARTHADDAAAPDAYLSAQRARYTSISRSSSVLPQQSRQYSVSLAPTIIPSVGPLINSLVSSGVSRYGGFKLLEKVAIYDGPGSVKPVPGSKEDVFKNKDLSLLEKRRLMRFLMFAAGDFADKPELEGKEETPFIQFLRETFSLDQRTTNALAYALAFCVSASGTVLVANISGDILTHFIVIRSHSPCSSACSKIFAFSRAIWRVSVPCGTLWRRRRNSSRFLPDCCSQRSDIHPRTQNIVDDYSG